MKKERRWLKSVIAASEQPLPALPWTRGVRRRPAVLKGTAAKVQLPMPARAA
ncbi:MAG: hypothetical protein LBE86_08570 [Gemmobacter sp.]|jgi:hypothetical protein|nr:hypothetical protein [Gemmobacter sp.]